VGCRSGRNHAIGHREDALTEAIDYLDTLVTAAVDTALAAQSA